MIAPLLLFAVLNAQQGDSLRLASLIQQAERNDPRRVQLDLVRRQSELRRANIRTSRLPVFSLEARAQHQSAVTRIPIELPNGQSPPAPPHDTYDGLLHVQQSVLDPTYSARLRLQAAEADENAARVRTSLFSAREETIDAFFSVALAERRTAELLLVIRELEARLQEAEARVAQRVSLPSEAATLHATLLLRRQDLAELEANRRAALAVLETLTGASISNSTLAVFPELNAAFDQARSNLPSAFTRPEQAQFAAARARLERSAQLIDAQDAPRVSAYARAGYGRPGLNQMSRSADSYWLAGVLVQWSPWNWRRSERERTELALQADILRADEQAFLQRITRQLHDELANIDRLRAALTVDDKIIALRERIDRETRVRFDERVASAAEYVDRNTELLQARLAKTRHQVELAHAQTRFLNSIGWEIR